jgi:S1-C subfamily serine protease
VLRVSRGSGAEAAGLRGATTGPQGEIVPGDIIVALDGKPIESVARLLATLDDHQVGDNIKLTVLREGKKTDVTLPLQAGG